MRRTFYVVAGENGNPCNRLRVLLHDLDMKQAELAAAIEVTPRTVSLWTTGKARVPGAVFAYLELLKKVRTLAQ